MQLASMGKVAHSVPFKKAKTKMTLYKGDAALEARRAVASKLTHSLIAALQKPRRLDDKPDWAPMQQLYDAGLGYDPVSAMPVFDPSACAPALLKALWRGFCGVADTINTKQMGQTDEALQDLQMRLHEHAAQITETKQDRRAGAVAKRPRASSPAASSSGEGTDTCPPARRQKTIRRRTDDDARSTSVLQFSGSDDTAEHQFDRTDFIGSCSQCGGPEGHCVTCRACFCAWCRPLVCKPCAPPAASPLLKSKCKPDSPLYPSPPPSPPAESLQLATLRGRSTTIAIKCFIEDVRVHAAGKRGKRSGAAPPSRVAKAAKLALLEDDEAGDAPDSPSAARPGIGGAVARWWPLRSCNATEPCWRPAARSETDWAAEELEWAARGARPMLPARDATNPPVGVPTFAGDDPPMRAVAPSRLQPNATPCCMSPLDARAACCGCAGDSGSESEDSGADSDDEERDAAAGFEPWQSEADARVLQLIIDGVERMQADVSLDGHQRALGVLQHVAWGVPDVFGSKSAYECWRSLLYADGLEESSESEGSESEDDLPLPPPRPPPVSQPPPAPLPLSEETCCQKHGCKGCTPSWPKAARRAVRPIRARHAADKPVAVVQFAGDAPTEAMSIDGDALSIDVEVKAEPMSVDGSRMSIEGGAATSVDGAAMDKALSAMCRDMTVLAHGKLCLAGSYALHRHLCEQGDFERAQWQPTDIDIFYSSGSGLDGDELRRRLSVMARSCQLQMLGVAAGVVDESQSMYDAFSKRPYATCLDDQDEACVAAFARKELMRLCSLEPARSRQCARRRCARTR